MKLDQFSEQARAALETSRNEAVRRGHTYLRVEHILFGVTSPQGGRARELLRGIGVTDLDIEDMIGPARAVDRPLNGRVRLAQETKQLLERSIAEARATRHRGVEVEHILLALLREPTSRGPQLLEALGVGGSELEDAILAGRTIRAVPPSRATKRVVQQMPVGDRQVLTPSVKFRSDAWMLPDEDLLGFVPVREGTFEMGSLGTGDTWAYSEEYPRHKVELDTFYIGRYPVTRAQFAVFADEAKHLARDSAWTAGPSDHPVVRVSWHGAIEYCRWLTDRMRAGISLPTDLSLLLREKGWIVTLPSEAEWEKAARGFKPQLFPWGDRLAIDLCNCHESQMGTTTAVGSYLGGASAFGLYDMSGNVWEWTRSLWGENHEIASFKYPYDPADGREDLEASDEVCRVMRGGGYRDSLIHHRCSSRAGGEPGGRDHDIGFRIALTPGGNSQS